MADLKEEICNVFKNQIDARALDAALRNTSPEEKFSIILSERSNRRGTLIHKLSKSGNKMEFIQLSMEHLADSEKLALINAIDCNGNTALHLLANSDDLTAFIDLIPESNQLSVISRENRQGKHCLDLVTSSHSFTTLFDSLTVGNKVHLITGYEHQNAQNALNNQLCFWLILAIFVAALPLTYKKQKVRKCAATMLMTSGIGNILINLWKACHCETKRLDRNTFYFAYLSAYISNMKMPYEKLYMLLHLVEHVPRLSTLLKDFDNFQSVLFDVEKGEPIVDASGRSMLHTFARLQKFDATIKALRSLIPKKREQILTVEDEKGSIAQSLAAPNTKLERLLRWARTTVDKYFLYAPLACLIFYATERRQGAKGEMKSIKYALERLGILPVVCPDFDKNQILREIEKVQNHPDLTGLLVVIMCHGESGAVVPKIRSGERLYIQNILRKMEHDNLTGKPKMLWVQACNEHLVSGNSVSEGNDAAKCSPNMGLQDPCIPGDDFFYIGATLRGCVATRNLMIPKLARQLDKLKTDQDMVHVHRKLLRSMKKVSDQITFRSSTCDYRICLRDIFKF